MSLTGINFCKSPVADTKQQNNKPIFQPFRLLSTTNTMHEAKDVDFPFVNLTGHKVVDDPCISNNYDIMNSQPHFGEFLIDKASSFTKAAAFKDCNQFPMISISQLVGGFVGSKSQFRTTNRESHQIWDIVLNKLDEFITTKTNQTCYELSSLSQDIIGSFYQKSNSGLGFSASYIIGDKCESFHNKNIKNIAKSSPLTQNPTEVISAPVSAAVSSDSFVPSHSSCKTSIPANLEVVEQFACQPDSLQTDIGIQKITTESPQVFSVSENNLVAEHSTREECVTSGICEEERHPLEISQDPLFTVTSEVKQSYAEVAKMPQIKPKVCRPRPTPCGPTSASKQFRKMKNQNFSRNYQDSHQRGLYSSDWRRHQGSFSEKRERSRDGNGKHIRDSADSSSLNFEQNFKNIPRRVSQNHTKKNHEGLKHVRHFKTSALKTVPELPSHSTKEMVSGVKSVPSKSPTVTFRCQFSNFDKNSCKNWRCRQHLEKSNAKQNLRQILKDNAIGNNLEDQSVNSDLSPSPTETSCKRLNTLENFINTTPRHSPPLGKALEKSPESVHDCQSEIPSLPTVPKSEDEEVVPQGECTAPAEPTSGSNCCIINLMSLLSPRSPGDRPKSSPRSRSISEDSKASSSSASSLGSCRLVLEATFRGRFSSECDSEDSFVVFEGGVECGDSDFESGSDSSEDSSDADGECDSASLPDCEDETDDAVRMPKMGEVDEEIGRQLDGKKSPCKKVRFAARPGLAVVHPMVAWDFAYRAARCGPWEEAARDRGRFAQRVERTGAALAPVLGAEHRRRVAALLLGGAGRHDVRERR